jgi:hypothetical protein
MAKKVHGELVDPPEDCYRTRDGDGALGDRDHVGAELVFVVVVALAEVEVHEATLGSRADHLGEQDLAR